MRSDVFALTERETQVLKMIGKGWTNKKIAAHLGIKHTTIRTTFIESLHSKLGTHNLTQLALRAHRDGYVSLDEIDYGNE